MLYVFIYLSHTHTKLSWPKLCFTHNSSRKVDEADITTISITPFNIAFILLIKRMKMDIRILHWSVSTLFVAWNIFFSFLVVVNSKALRCSEKNQLFILR